MAALLLLLLLPKWWKHVHLVASGHVAYAGGVLLGLPT
jgi:hypothetical protein